MPHEAEIATRLDALVAKAFAGAQRLSYFYDAATFGNVIAYYQVGGLVLRFLRDRSIESIDLGPDCDRLVDSGTLFVALDLLVDAKGWDAIAGRIGVNLPAIAAAFAPGRAAETQAKVKAVGAENVRKLFPKSSG